MHDRRLLRLNDVRLPYEHLPARSKTPKDLHAHDDFSRCHPPCSSGPARYTGAGGRPAPRGRVGPKVANGLHPRQRLPGDRKDPARSASVVMVSRSQYPSLPEFLERSECPAKDCAIGDAVSAWECSWTRWSPERREQRCRSSVARARPRSRHSSHRSPSDGLCSLFVSVEPRRAHVIPAKAGIHALRNEDYWVPAFAGTTPRGAASADEPPTASRRSPDHPSAVSSVVANPCSRHCTARANSGAAGS